jgi:hypothetical protein
MGLTSQEAVAIGKDFEGTGPANDFATLDLAANNADNQLGAAHAGVFVDAFFLRELEQRGHRHPVEVVETARTGADGTVDPINTSVDWSVNAFCSFSAIGPINSIGPFHWRNRCWGNCGRWCRGSGKPRGGGWFSRLAEWSTGSGGTQK